MENKVKFTNMLGDRVLTGKALENYKTMQCRPLYNRYCTRYRLMCRRMGWNESELMSFDDFVYYQKRVPKQLLLF